MCAACRAEDATCRAGENPPLKAGLICSHSRRGGGSRKVRRHGRREGPPWRLLLPEMGMSEVDVVGDAVALRPAAVVG